MIESLLREQVDHIFGYAGATICPLADALKEGEIAGAGLDVLCQEPMRPENPLFAIKDSRKLIITPHMAWAPVETRERLMRCVYRNIEEIK